MPNSLRIEHLSDIIPKTQIWLVVNLPVFMSVYIHFSVPPTRITDLVRNVSDEKKLLLIWNSHPCQFFFAFIDLVCVHSLIQLMNTPFITFVL